MHELLISKGNKPRKGVVKKCLRCESEFYVRPSNLAGKFCSRKCNNDTEREKSTAKIIPCQICGKEIIRRPSEIVLRNKKHSYCSKECQVIGSRKTDKERVTPRNKKSDNIPEKVWSIKYADTIFSLMIRKRDPICVACRRRPSTEASHFYERHHSATRYHPENCDALCHICHQAWEGRKNGYEEFKREQLGARRYLDLQRLAYSTMPREKAIIKFMKNNGEKNDKRE